MLDEPFTRYNMNYKQLAPEPSEAFGYLYAPDVAQVKAMQKDLKEFKENLRDPKEILEVCQF